MLPRPSLRQNNDGRDVTRSSRPNCWELLPLMSLLLRRREGSEVSRRAFLSVYPTWLCDGLYGPAFDVPRTRFVYPSGTCSPRLHLACYAHRHHPSYCSGTKRVLGTSKASYRLPAYHRPTHLTTVWNSRSVRGIDVLCHAMKKSKIGKARIWSWATKRQQGYHVLGRE